MSPRVGRLRDDSTGIYPALVAVGRVPMPCCWGAPLFACGKAKGLVRLMLVILECK